MIGWFDCGAGASGDMFLAALVDAGVPLEVMREAVAALPVEPIALTASDTRRHGLAATSVTVEVAAGAQDRRYTAIRELLAGAALSSAVRDKAIEVFTRLATAEAAAHGVGLEEVHFHEVGALDALADVVGACAGTHWLRQHRQVTSFTASTVTVGGGMTHAAHGAIPLPAPATLRVLAEVAAPVVGMVEYEACTPTGAALLAAHVDAFGPLPPMVPDTIGVGAGKRDDAAAANVLRLVIGSPLDERRETQTRLEANVDDLDPRVWPEAMAALFAAGAVDVWLAPIVMKKGRPAHTVHALCSEAAAESVAAAMFTHTSTIGVRCYRVDKHALDRKTAMVSVDNHRVGVKIARHRGRVVNVSVEYDDVAAAAAAANRPVQEMLARATAEAERRYRPS